MLRFTFFIFLFSFLFQNQSDAQCWNLVWADEFNGTSLNTSKWGYEIGNSGWGNNEWQYYTDRVDNTTVSNGTLKIIAKQENYNGANYTSARIRTKNQGDWTYGKMEASIKTPYGQGIWPAFWMLPTDNVYGGWPHSGEIDIMELVGHQPATIHGTAHYAVGGGHQYQGAPYTLSSGNYSQGFHTFTVEWKPDTIEWFMDGTKYYELTATAIGANNWIFDKDFHFLLNVAVGGNWPGYPNGTTVFPQTMEVEYVRVYQDNGNMTIAGDTAVSGSQATVDYSLPDIPGATYSWTVPTGASIVSGSGTEAITVNLNGNSGQVCCAVNTGCGTQNTCINVSVITSYFDNGGFEDDLNHWSTRLDGGGTANFSATSASPFIGLKSGLVHVTNPGVNLWDIQLGRSGFSVVGGTHYTLSFWARGNMNGLDIRPAFVEDGSFAWLGGGVINITDSWQHYSLAFTAPFSAANALFNFDLGDELGAFYFDDVWFGETANLPVELGFFKAFAEKNETVSLQWNTYSENNTERFDIEQSTDGIEFSRIGSVPAQGNSIVEQHYEFVDKNPKNGTTFYRLKQVDLDGKYDYSPIRSVSIEKTTAFSISPNPTNGILNISGTQPISKIEITDLQGKTVLNLDNPTDNFETLHIENLPKGTYFLRIFSGGEVFGERFVRM